MEHRSRPPNGSSHTARGLVSRFAGSWQADSIPDVFAFLEEHPEATPRERGEILLRDQEERRWRKIPIRTDEYLDRLRGLEIDEDLRRALLARGESSVEWVGSSGDDTFSRLERLGPLESDATPDLQGKDGWFDGAEEPEEAPESLGRYPVEGKLGAGAFGVVYLARDDELERRVAIKVPHRHRVSNAAQVARCIEEARILGRLEDPAVVPVYDAGRLPDGRFFVVSKYIEGGNLAARIREGPLSIAETVDLISSLARALHRVHLRGIVHRDIKPANILIDDTGKPYLVDFGLAREEEGRDERPSFAGTPPYMSPEQARSEGHLVDGRSDLFSLGVVLYELLTGRLPFGSAGLEVLERIQHVDPRPPRQIDDRIPRELERICLKALSKRVADRYTTALDMAEDLEYAVPAVSAAPEESPAPAPEGQPVPGDGVDDDAPVLSRGLRSFEETDAPFFLRLLPGPRRRDGLPESIGFWKGRIEDLDADRAFRVGLIYGPSGSGKSSLVRAGLLPRLSARVSSVLVDATPGSTQDRILAQLRKRLPALEPELDLRRALMACRRGSVLPAGRKLLLVIDQFEQWLHGKRIDETTGLVQALRQCDGARVQCLLLVRDDFWMSMTRFFRELDVRLVEGENSAAADLFDPPHATRVLRMFGESFGVLPKAGEALTRDQREFLEKAVASLAEEGKVIPVRLSLFADMARWRDWVPRTLRELGGAGGVGISFLEQTFEGSRAPLEHRVHADAARSVLQTLLPEPGTEIRLQAQTRRKLLLASGYARRPEEFEELMEILDHDLRLVTPVDPGSEPPEIAAGAEEESDQRRYELTHDYLVPSLRAWLTRHLRASRRGRAALRLAERASLWSARRERKQLPSFREWLGIRLFTRPSSWSAKERSLMRAAGRVNGAKALVFAVVAGLVAWGGYAASVRVKGRILSDRLLHAATPDVAAIIPDLRGYRPWVEPRLRRAYEESSDEGAHGRRRRLHSSLGLLPGDSGQVPYLRDRLLEGNVEEVAAISRAFSKYARDVEEGLWNELAGRSSSRAGFNTACALAALDAPDPRWRHYGSYLAEVLTAKPSYELRRWGELLRPLRAILLPHLEEIFRAGGDLQERGAAAALLSDYLAGEEERLVSLVPEAHPSHLKALVPALEGRESALEALVEKPVPASDDEEELAARGRERAAVALALLLAGAPDPVWPLLRASPDPHARTCLIHSMETAGVDPQILVDRLEEEPDASIRRAIIVALGEYRVAAFPEPRRTEVVAMLEDMVDAPDPGVHAATVWLLRRWGYDPASRLAEMSGGSVEGERRWYVTPEGHTMVVVTGDPAYRPFRLLRRGEEDDPHRSGTPRSFAISSLEVTVRQFLGFRPDHDYARTVSPDPECPVNEVSYQDVMEYCLWLSREHGIPEEEWCYVRGEDERLESAEDFHLRRGYRLPLLAEWELACRGGTDTRTYFGAAELAPRYAWYLENSSDRTHPVGLLVPNDFGLHDVHGNVTELVHCCSRSDHEYGRVAGAHYRHSVSSLHFKSRSPFARRATYEMLGFRIVRTVKE